MGGGGCWRLGHDPRPSRGDQAERMTGLLAPRHEEEQGSTHPAPPVPLLHCSAGKGGTQGAVHSVRGGGSGPASTAFIFSRPPQRAHSALSLAALPAQHTNPRLRSPACLLLPRQSHHPRPAQREHKGKPRGEGEVPSSCQSSFCARGQILFTGSCSRAEPWERSNLGGKNSRISLTLPFPIPPWCPCTSPIADRCGGFPLHYKQ